MSRGKPRTGFIEQIRNDVEMKGENWEEIQENRKWENKDSSVIVVLYLWERLKNVDDNTIVILDNSFCEIRVGRYKSLFVL